MPDYNIADYLRPHFNNRVMDYYNSNPQLLASMVRTLCFEALSQDIDAHEQSAILLAQAHDRLSVLLKVTDDEELKEQVRQEFWSAINNGVREDVREIFNAYIQKPSEGIEAYLNKAKPRTFYGLREGLKNRDFISIHNTDKYNYGLYRDGKGWFFLEIKRINIKQAWFDDALWQTQEKLNFMTQDQKDGRYRHRVPIGPQIQEQDIMPIIRKIDRLSLADNKNILSPYERLEQGIFAERVEKEKRLVVAEQKKESKASKKKNGSVL